MSQIEHGVWDHHQVAARTNEGGERYPDAITVWAAVEAILAAHRALEEADDMIVSKSVQEYPDFL